MCRNAGMDVKNQLSSLEPEQADAIKLLVKRGGKAAPAPAAPVAAAPLPTDIDRRIKVLPAARKAQADVPVAVPPPAAAPTPPAPVSEMPPQPEPSTPAAPAQPAARISEPPKPAAPPRTEPAAAPKPIQAPPPVRTPEVTKVPDLASKVPSLPGSKTGTTAAPRPDVGAPRPRSP